MKRASSLVLLAVLLCFGGCSRPAVHGHKPTPGISLRGEAIPLGRLPRVAVPERYRIALRIDPKADHFSGHAEIDVNFLSARRSLFLHGLGLNVSGVTVRLASGQSFAAHYDQVDPSGVVRLIFVDKVPAGKATLIFDYDAPYAAGLEGLYKVVDRGDSYVFTQFESTDARRAFPSFDEPGFKTPFDVTVLAPRGDKVIGNTPIASARRSARGISEIVFQTTRPLPTYLVALAVGPLDVVDGGTIPPSQYRPNPIHLRGITARGNGPRIAYALSLTPRIVTALEDYFGIAYPFQKLDVLAVPDFAAGAMENAGAITFRERLLLVDPDAPLQQKRGTLLVQAHELAHQWFGDLVTPAWWDDIWLNESFATWMSSKAAQAVLPEQNFDTETLRDGFSVMNLDELPSARQIHQPINDLDDLGNAFDDITYSKGASVLRMFEAYVGPEDWRRGIHAYLTRFASRNATAHDFIGAIAATTGHPELVASFDDFIDRPGIPYLHLKPDCVSGGLDLVQSVYVPLAFQAPSRSWHVPVCLESPAGVQCKLVDAPKLTLPNAGSCDDAFFPNALGAGYYRFAFDQAGWAAQLKSAAGRNPAEQITLLSNEFAALYAGDARPADVLALVRELAPKARWDVLAALAERLSGLRQRLAPDDLATYRRMVAADFGARWKAAGLFGTAAEQPASALARSYLAALMVSEARDPAAIAQLSSAAHAMIGPDGRVSGRLAPDLRAEAMRAGLLADPAYADRLIGIFRATNSEDARRDIVYAFAGSDDAAGVKKLLALTTGFVRTGELRYFSQYMPQEPVARAAMWNFLTANFAAIQKRLTVQRMSRFTVVLETACEQGSRDALNAFFQPRISTMMGGVRRLAHSNEKIDRCIAFRKALGPELRAALAGTH